MRKEKTNSFTEISFESELFFHLQTQMSVGSEVKAFVVLQKFVSTHPEVIDVSIKQKRRARRERKNKATHVQVRGPAIIELRNSLPIKYAFIS